MNTIGKDNKSINNNRLQVPNNDLEVFDDTASQNYYSSDDSNYGDNHNNSNSNNGNNGEQKNIPLVERIDPPQAEPEKDDVER